MRYLYFFFLCLSLFAQEDHPIFVGSVEVVRNLNPYLAQSQVELALKDIVFPGLIANFGEQKESVNSCEFRGLILDEEDGFQCGQNENDDFLTFYLPSHIHPSTVQKNVEMIKFLGPRSIFSWYLKNKITHKRVSNGQVELTIGFQGSNTYSRLTAATFPMVDHQNLRRPWKSEREQFIDNRALYKLNGFSKYAYQSIDLRNQKINLAPKDGGGRSLQIKTYPTYNAMVKGLESPNLDIAFNISPLTPLAQNISYAQLNFANQFISYLVVTEAGRKLGLDDPRLIKRLRFEFINSFRRNTDRTTAAYYPRTGFFTESAGLDNTYKPPDLKKKRRIRIIYPESTLNKRIVTTLEGAFSRLGFRLERVSVDSNSDREKINFDRYHLSLQENFLLFPAFLNLRYYQEMISPYPHLHGFGHSIESLLTQESSMDALNREAKNIENQILNSLPVIFLVEYTSLIAYSQNVRNYQGKKNPFFFYKLEEW